MKWEGTKMNQVSCPQMLIVKRGVYQSAFDMLCCYNKQSPNLTGLQQRFMFIHAPITCGLPVVFIPGLGLNEQLLCICQREKKKEKKRHTMAIKGYGSISLAKAWRGKDMNVLPQES